ncbi:related to fungal specific transcription factor [Phialocephala subalpina]|uniref:Related to fungal specific transcription factor n=1 Tax=Phialocephala subalpina TaxID=576137 RepID=A0A1L7XQT6_9HELO|nr:related to fungal specific transcription factor [Phialocephala subalpina]
MITSPSHPHASDTPPLTTSGGDHRERLRSHLSQRRDKPQLSCNLCKRRKVRCDRQTPCGTCSRRGLASSCVYNADAQQSILPRPAGTVHERIQQLESLVISLMQQDTSASASTTTGSTSVSDPPRDFAQPVPIPDTDIPISGGPQLSEDTSVSSTSPNGTFLPLGDDNGAVDTFSSVPVDCGSMNMDSAGTPSYVGSAHWVAILDSISELKEHFEQEEATRRLATEDNEAKSGHSNWPQLLYGCPQITKAEILSSIPTRREADRLVSRYFTLDIAPGVLHSGQFLSEYEHFWEEPSITPIMWIGLLFTIMCLGAQHASQSTSAPPDPQHFFRVNILREKIVQCLRLGKYTKGGPFVLETLIQYYMIEHFLCQDTEFEIWVLHCILIPMSFRMGLHRDPKHFKLISPFAGEIRRRVWATVFQIDICLSLMTGLPRMIKPQQCDTEEPRNLLDSDIEEETTEVRKPRVDSESTPVLYLIAKNRIISVGGIISDLAHDIRPYPYTELARFETLLEDTRKSLPSSLHWHPLPQSITETSRTIIQRMYLDIFFHKMRITLYKKYLSASMTKFEYAHAREICLESAVTILDYHHLLAEETHPDGRLSSVSSTYISILNHDFLLAASVLCFYIKHLNGNNLIELEEEVSEKIRGLLRKSREIWLRSSDISKEAQKAVESLNIVLGTPNGREAGEFVDHQFEDSSEFFAEFENPAGWSAHQASYDLPFFGLEVMTNGYPGLSSAIGTWDERAPSI